MNIAAIYWNPSREIFTIPGIGYPLYWYSFLFAIGYFSAYFFLSHNLKKHCSKDKYPLLDTLTLWLFFGVLFGARLGHVIFYDLQHYLDNPIEIVQTWHGGLASHGGVLGAFTALHFFHKKYSLHSFNISIRQFFDIFALSGMILGTCIRIGNFFNQEIIGTKSSLPWAVTFGSPWDIRAIMPCHPVQLYESFLYLVLFTIGILIKKQQRVKDGHIALWSTFLAFSGRFLLEFFKLPQSEYDFYHMLSTGQLLCIPIILITLFFIIFDNRNKSNIR